MPTFDDSIQPIMRIVAEEYSGKNGNTRYANVVCSSNGKRLMPFYYPRPSTGRFVANYTIDTVSCTGDGIITISKHYAERADSQRVLIVSKTVFEGNYEDLAETLPQFVPAVDSAFEKIACASCSHVHFAASNSAS